MPGWYVTKEDEYTHVHPIDDIRHHILKMNCWCKPSPDTENINVIIHHSLDRREDDE